MNVERLWKVAKRYILVTIGGLVLIYGFHEFQSGRWIGLVWVLAGAHITYIGSREIIEELRQKRAEKSQLSRKS